MPILPRDIDIGRKVPLRHMLHLRHRPLDQLVGHVAERVQHDGERRRGRAGQVVEVLERIELVRVDEVGKGILEDDGDVGEVEIVPRPVGKGPGVVHCGRQYVGVYSIETTCGDTYR